MRSQDKTAFLPVLCHSTLNNGELHMPVDGLEQELFKLQLNYSADEKRQKYVANDPKFVQIIYRRSARVAETI